MNQLQLPPEDLENEKASLEISLESKVWLEWSRLQVISALDNYE
ncbi:MAG: hypothetical protein WBA89_00575 [Microcoleus sp.]